MVSKPLPRTGRTRAALGVSLLALSAVLATGAARAQSAPGRGEGAAVAPGDEETIVVTGFRRSVQTSLETKRLTPFIADIITADDIAGLPDVSIAESLARLPGVTSQRTGGQASAINIRGLSQDLVSATLNGREQVATSGNRVIEFDQYPSELISQAAVYKTPMASIIEGGVAGRVELKTARPLSNRKDLDIQVNVRGLYNDRAGENPDVSEFGYRVSGSIQAKFLDNTLGVAVGYARLYQPNVATRFVSFDYPVPGTNGSPVRDLNGNGVPEIYNFGFEGIQFGGQETRDGVIAVIQYEPVDSLRVLVDGYYSKFTSDVRRRGFRAFATQSGDNQIINPLIVDNTIVGGRFVNQVGSNGFGFAVGTEQVNQDESRQDELYTIGGNVAYDLSPNVTAAVDVAYSRGTSFFNNSGINVRPYVRNAAGQLVRADSVPGVVSVDYQLNSLNLPTIRGISTDFTQFGAAGSPGFYLDGQFIVPQRDTDELFAVAGDFTVRGEGFFKALRLGTRYSTRQATRTITSFNRFDIPGAPLALPANLTRTAGFGGPYGRAGLPRFGVVDIDGAFNLAFGNTLGVNQPTDQVAFGFTIDQSFVIDEDTYAGYAQVDLGADLGADWAFRGNVGVRVVATDQSSTVNATIPGTSQRRLVTRGQSFVDYLPSINLILAKRERDLFRFSVSQQISRPRFFDLRGSIDVNTGADGNTTGGGGNPALDPFKATQFDFAYEHYFSRTGVFAVQAYYKELSSYIINGVIPQFNFVENGVTPPPIPGTSIPGNPVGSFSAPINGQGGEVYGVEINFTKALDMLPAPFDGLGVQLNYAWAQSNLTFPSSTSGANINLPLPGLSEHVANPVVFYQKNGFGARVSIRYRSEFVSPQIGISELVLTSAPETVVDGQMSYEFQKGTRLEGLTLLAQVVNATDEPTRTFFGNRAQTGTIQNFGRQIFLGATIRF